MPEVSMTNYGALGVKQVISVNQEHLPNHRPLSAAQKRPKSGLKAAQKRPKNGPKAAQKRL